SARIHPYLYKRDFVLGVVSNGFPGFFLGRYRIHHVVPGGVTGRAGPRPRYAWTGGSKQRGVRYDSVLDSERHVAPREASGLRHFGISRRHEQVEMVGR